MDFFGVQCHEHGLRMGLIILFSVVARTDESFVYGTDQSALMLITQLVLFQYHLQLLSFSHYNVPGLNL
jgi:hypothetical protein